MRIAVAQRSLGRQEIDARRMAHYLAISGEMSDIAVEEYGELIIYT